MVLTYHKISHIFFSVTNPSNLDYFIDEKIEHSKGRTTTESQAHTMQSYDY